MGKARTAIEIAKKKKISVDAERGTIFRLPPDSFRIIGRDTAHKQGEHVLWQDRALEPVDEAFAQAMAFEGFTSVIEVRKDGPYLEVVAGRRRIIAARRANEIRASMGKEPLQVSFSIVKGTDLDMFGRMLGENANRKDLTPLSLAMELKNFLDMGASEERAARTAGKTVVQLRQTLKLLDLHSDVLGQLRAGNISASAAQNLSDLPREIQVQELKSLLSGTVKPTVAEVKSRVKAHQDGEEAFKAPGKRILNKILADDSVEEVFGEKGVQAIRWVIGDLNPRQIKGLTALIAKLK